ncbi:hypothetical protein K504DRAFT_451143 [Pleomassaria siparia CBS 279.74]|uniref:Zinc-binding loop region of homing endonuclease domain-containing protein n=1 Tax=Pleomassaria siparia CBS 279.74 TaxID=1314801 RepID=A0A6G1JTI7_9PLEO|nr:hypothetical protein K504DRAFT_451143 [Pleomassaria siparia CBS 279.74]
MSSHLGAWTRSLKRDRGLETPATPEQAPLTKRSALFREVIVLEAQTTPQEIIVIPDDVDEEIGKGKSRVTEGTGTQEDPIRVMEWGPGGIISSKDHGIVYTVLDDEEEITLDRLHSPGSSSHKYRSMSRTLTLDEEEDAIDEDNINEIGSLSNSPPLTTSPYDGLGSTRPSLSRTSSPVPSFRRGEEETRDSGVNCIIIDDDIDGPEYVYSQDWSEIKDEGEEEAPQLSHSQETQGTEDGERVDTPNCNRRSDDKQHDTWNALTGEHSQLIINRANLIKKKQLFYEVYGPKILLHLEKRLSRFRASPDLLNDSECWLYPKRIRPGHKGALEITVTFRDDDNEIYQYRMNIGIVSMFVAGLMTEECKHGIIHHSWHASHLCGNWSCSNPRHLVAEPGSVNSRRNACFHGFKGTCVHAPRCMKELRTELQPGTLKYDEARRWEEDASRG